MRRFSHPGQSGAGSPFGRQSGATLIEVLIAVTLVGLLMVAIATSLGIGLRAMERTNARLDLNRRVQRTQEILEQQLLHLMPGMAACMLANPEAPQAILFFDGQPTQMRFLSAYSFREGARGYPRIVEYAVIPGDPSKNPPGLRLIVNELFYAGPRTTGQFCFGTTLQFDGVIGRQMPQYTPVAPQPSSFILADRLQAVRFRYLEYRQPPLPPEWVDRASSSAYPEAVSIELLPLPDARTGTQPLSLVLPLRVDKLPGGKYED